MLDERPAPASEAAPDAREIVVRVDQGRTRRRFGVAGPLIGLALAVVLVVGGFALAAAIVEELLPAA